MIKDAAIVGAAPTGVQPVAVVADFDPPGAGDPRLDDDAGSSDVVAGRPALNPRRLALTALPVIGGIATLLCVLLVVGAWLDDAAINARTGRATAEVVSVTFNRTVVRYETPDGAVRIPADGVLYPEGLEAGELVRVEYDTGNPELVRVAGRGAWLTYLPAGTTVLVVWAVLGPLLWWLRRSPRR